jgi:protein-tyrosine phosphatase
MSDLFVISTLSLQNGGNLGLCRLPGRSGDLAGDIAVIKAWKPGLVVSMTLTAEMKALGAGDLAKGLIASGISWRQFPVADFGTPDADVDATWPKLSKEITQTLDTGQNVLLHCHGGIGRSGMVALRLLIESDEDPASALQRLRLARPGAVETQAQMAWAQIPWIKTTRVKNV